MFVLRAIPYLEYGQLLDVFTRQHGLVRAVSRSSRRPNSPLKAFLQPFNLISATLRGESELQNIAMVEVQQSFSLGIQETFCGQYLNEILFYLLEKNIPHPQLFDSYQFALSYLHNYGMAGSEPIFRNFELNMLSEIGYGINFETDFSGAMLRDDNNYVYDSSSGFVPVGLSSAGAFSGNALKRLGAGIFDDHNVLATAKKLCRQAIDSHLGSHKLQSRALFAMYRSGKIRH